MFFCFYDKHCGPKQETVYFIFKLLCHNPSLKESDSQLKRVPGGKKWNREDRAIPSVVC